MAGRKEAPIGLMIKYAKWLHEALAYFSIIYSTDSEKQKAIEKIRRLRLDVIDCLDIIVPEMYQEIE